MDHVNHSSQTSFAIIIMQHVEGEAGTCFISFQGHREVEGECKSVGLLGIEAKKQKQKPNRMKAHEHLH